MSLNSSNEFKLKALTHLMRLLLLLLVLQKFAEDVLWLKKQAKVQIQRLLLQIRSLHGSNLKCPETNGSKRFVPGPDWLLCAHLLLNKCGP